MPMCSSRVLLGVDLSRVLLGLDSSARARSRSYGSRAYVFEPSHVEVVSTIGTYGVLVPMNTPLLQPRDVREFIT